MDITTSSNRTLDIIHQKAGKFSNLLEVFDIPLELESATHYSNPAVNKIHSLLEHDMAVPQITP